jgi:peptide/nickel transport system substrate-binding protein
MALTGKKAREHAMKRVFCAIITVGLGLGAFLSACSGPPQQQPTAPAATPAATPAESGAAPEEALGGDIHLALPAATPAESGAAPGSNADGTPVDGDTAMVWLYSEMPTLNPMLSSIDMMGDRIARMVYDSLLERDNETWEMKPSVAESYEISPDHLTFTFKLRHDVIFSDGAPLSAEDVKFVFDKLMDPATDAMSLRNYFLNVDRCEVVDPYTVRFVCKEPYFKTLISLGEDLRILPKHIFSEGDFNKHPNNRKPIGSGPYLLEAWDTNDKVVLTKNEKYWGTKPHLQHLQYKIISDGNAALQVLERGELDYMGLTPDQWFHQAAKPEFEAKFNKLAFYVPNHGYIGWNLRRPLFADKRVRQAMTLLLNRQLILDTIFRGLGVVVSNGFIYGSAEYNKDLAPWPFDPERAKQLLAEAGWKDANGDGVLEKDGTPFNFEFLVPSGVPEYEQMATVYKEELAKAGIQMTIKLLEWATFVDTVHNLNFDAMTMMWQLDPEQDPYQIWHSSQIKGGSNYPGFVNAEVDKLIEDARKEFDPAKRVELYHRMNIIIHEEQPYTFLFCNKATVAIDKRFRNVKAYRLRLDAKEWWVPTALQRYK